MACREAGFPSFPQRKTLMSANKLSKFDAFPSILLNRIEKVLFVLEMLFLADLKLVLSCNSQEFRILEMVWTSSNCCISNWSCLSVSRSLNGLYRGTEFVMQLKHCHCLVKWLNLKWFLEHSAWYTTLHLWQAIIRLWVRIDLLHTLQLSLVLFILNSSPSRLVAIMGRAVLSTTTRPPSGNLPLQLSYSSLYYH